MLGSASTATATAKSSAGSGSRPGPASGPVNRPVSGRTTTAPRLRSVSTLAWVAACSHISLCMAGEKTIGQCAVSSTFVSRSSARPDAARASRSAVAGATKTRSISCPILTCGTRCASSNTEVCTGRPDNAAQVLSPMNSSAATVGTTVTSWPAPSRRRNRSHALYAAIPPDTPRTMRLIASSYLVNGGGCSGRLEGRLGGLVFWRLRVDVSARQLALVYLAQCDGERLLLHCGLNQRADVVQQALAELGVVGVDLPSALGREQDQLVLGI